MSLLATQHSGLLAQFILSFYRVWRGVVLGDTCLVSPGERDESLKAFRLPQEILGIVGAREPP